MNSLSSLRLTFSLFSSRSLVPVLLYTISFISHCSYVSFPYVLFTYRCTDKVLLFALLCRIKRRQRISKYEWTTTATFTPSHLASWMCCISARSILRSAMKIALVSLENAFLLSSFPSSPFPWFPTRARRGLRNAHAVAHANSKNRCAHVLACLADTHAAP